MPAADRTHGVTASRLIARLQQLFRGRRRRRHTGSSVAATASFKPTQNIDMGDLAVAQVVHDLRNQLTVMIACTEVISRLVPENQAEQDVAELRRCAERASMLTRELLMAVRRPRGRVDLNDVVAGAAATISRLTGQKICVRVRLADGPIPVVADPLEIERIVLNLALNARDAMALGGVLSIETTVTTTQSAGRFDGMEPGPCARLSVSDTGCGMTPEVTARMFEPFFTTKSSGTGLGLSSVAFTVQQLRGTVSSTSHPGRGTCVEVLLPLATRSHTAPGVA